ncbi:beta-lactamase hydrolase domain-containing protein [Haloferula chungangensis]|uniref:Beta-lactamase hydrolase domain-containing protein n=1 Tax=Haloferula chungangensis TaxID=1048331 RepID=A0ABW2L7H8_9BACT
MKGSTQVSPKLSIGAQPAPEDLHQIATSGFKSVVNLRTEDEEDQQLTPAEEGSQVRELGLEYRHIPVSPKALNDETVDRFRAELSELPTPILIHCASGKRAGALTTIYFAIDKGLTGDEALSFAENEFDFSCDNEEMRDFVRDSIDARR